MDKMRTNHIIYLHFTDHLPLIYTTQTKLILGEIAMYYNLCRIIKINKLNYNPYDDINKDRPI